MMLSDDQVKEFQEIYKATFGEEISFKEAYDQGIRLLCLMQIIFMPMTVEESDYIEQRINAMVLEK
jgi:hypothetical protein